MRMLSTKVCSLPRLFKSPRTLRSDTLFRILRRRCPRKAPGIPLAPLTGMHTTAPSEVDKSRSKSAAVADARPQLPWPARILDPTTASQRRAPRSYRPRGAARAHSGHLRRAPLRRRSDACGARPGIAPRRRHPLRAGRARLSCRTGRASAGDGRAVGDRARLLRVPADEPEGAILARLGTELNGDVLVIRCDVLRSPVVDRFLAAARARPGTSLWAAIGGVPAGLALVRREDAAWLDVPGRMGAPRSGSRQASGSSFATRRCAGWKPSRTISARTCGFPPPAPPAGHFPLPVPRSRSRLRRRPRRPPGRQAATAGCRSSTTSSPSASPRRAQLAHATTEARQRQVSVESILLERHGIREADLAAALTLYYRCPYVSLDERTVLSPELLSGLQRPRLRAGAWLPIKRVGDVVTVAVDDPHDLLKVDAIEAVLRPRKVTLVVAVRERILGALDEMTGTEGRPGTVVEILGEVAAEPVTEDAPEAGNAEISENDSTVVRLANQIIIDAYRARASDIHLEPRGAHAGHGDPLPRRRHCVEYQRIPPALPESAGGAPQDHGPARHRRASQAPGRQDPGAHPGPERHRAPRGHRPHRGRQRGRGAAPPGLVRSRCPSTRWA